MAALKALQKRTLAVVWVTIDQLSVPRFVLRDVEASFTAVTKT